MTLGSFPWPVQSLGSPIRSGWASGETKWLSLGELSPRVCSQIEPMSGPRGLPCYASVEGPSSVERESNSPSYTGNTLSFGDSVEETPFG